MSMHVTFANKLKPTGAENGDVHRIEFCHSFRCPVKVFIEQVDTAQNPLGWTLTMEAKNDSLIKAFRSDLVKELVRYIEQRTRQKMNTVPFKTMIDLSSAQNLKVSEQLSRKVI